VIRRLVLPAVFAVAAYYALFGGEYSALDTRGVHAQTEDARETLAALERATDSLAARADSLEHDDRTLETIARERFGMIREGEVLYRFALPPDEER
jgi:cell division protein FtsB